MIPQSVGVITYQVGHKKTLDVTLRLMAQGHRVTWYAFPFTTRPEPYRAIYADRPYQLTDLDPQDFCRRYGVDYRECSWDNLGTLKSGDAGPRSYYLHCTAKIVPAEFAVGHTVLNVHPSLLPHNRGVDAFKWSILKGDPLGVTLHKIDETIDGGIIMKRLPCPVLRNDNLADVCRRMYELECNLLASFLAHTTNNGSMIEGVKVDPSYPISHERIPWEEDARLEEIFEASKAKWIGAANLGKMPEGEFHVS